MSSGLSGGFWLCLGRIWVFGSSVLPETMPWSCRHLSSCSSAPCNAFVIRIDRKQEKCATPSPPPTTSPNGATSTTCSGQRDQKRIESLCPCGGSEMDDFLLPTSASAAASPLERPDGVNASGVGGGCARGSQKRFVSRGDGGERTSEQSAS